jgi:predicted esterase
LFTRAAPAAIAQTAPPATQPQVGRFQVQFTERSPHSEIGTQHRRHHIATDDKQRYELRDESYEVFVPESYDGERPFGLLVWVSPMPSGRLPQMWEKVIEQQNLIWIGANNSGNDRGVGVRFGLALDAVHNVTRRYAIDEGRIYVAGFSGGGKVSSMLAVIYPDVFRGAIPMGGANFYRNIPIPDKKSMMWPANFAPPPTKMLERARKDARIVLLIGTEDFNYQPVKITYEAGYTADKFEHVTLLEVPGLDHSLADETWLQKALRALDEPLIERAKDELAQAAELEKLGKLADAYKLYLAVSMHGGESLGERADARMAELFEKARLELVPAKRAVEAQQFAQAADLLLKMREKYGPATPPEVDELMRELESNPTSAAQIKAARDRDAATRREAEAAAALDVARMYLEKDAKRAHAALEKVAQDYPETASGKAATDEATRLMSDPKTRAQIVTDPKEAEADKLLVMAENYRRNRLFSKARERIDEVLKKYPTTGAAARARKLLEEVKREEKLTGTR